MIRHLLPVMVALCLLVAGGLVHGTWTDRWTPEPDPAVVAARFAALPSQVGVWRGTDDEVSPRELRGLTGYLLRRYSRPDGTVVTLVLMGGPTRHVATHMPDACYAGSGFTVGTATRTAVADVPEPLDLWTAEMTKTRQADQFRLRIFYGWNSGSGWEAADAPRVRYASAKTLYKLYLIREVGTEATTADEPCLDLMARLQPALEEIVR